MSKTKEIKTNAMRFLDRQKIPYKVIQYECEEFTDGIAAAKKTGLPVELSFKTLVTKGKSGSCHVFVIPVTMELDLKAAARSAGEKSVAMIHVKEINQLTGYIRGGCSPLGMKKDYDTIIDSHALSHKEIAVSGGRIGSSILLDTVDLIRACRAKTADVAV